MDRHRRCHRRGPLHVLERASSGKGDEHVTENLRGILAVLAGSAAFVVNDAIVKLLSAELPSGEIIVVRGTLATILLAAAVAVLGASRPLAILMTPMMTMRLVAAAGATTFIVISLRYVPLA